MSQLSLRKVPRPVGRPETAAAIKRWTRAALSVGAEAVVSVNELACAIPGCAPRKTVVLVLRSDEPTRKLSIDKPLMDVTEEDVTSGWSQLQKAPRSLR